MLALSDEEFVRSFEDCTLPGEQFHHADHIRLTWILLRSGDVETAGNRIASAIVRFATHNGSPAKYHETVTRAWLRLVAAAMEATPSVGSFEEFARAHPELLDKGLLLKYYSARLLQGDEARMEWVEPDIAPLP